MNLNELQVAKQMIDEELARREFVDFCQFIDPNFQVARHHAAIGELLDSVTAGRRDRVFVGMPPRHGKSMMISIYYSAYWLGLHPDKNIIHISYSASLSNEFSRQVRGIVRDNSAYKLLFPNVQLDPEKRNVQDWKLTAGGGFKSVGVQAGIAGHGADLMIIDDPHSETDWLSPTTLDNIFFWFTGAARTRLHPGAAIVMVMTRWHPLDLYGRLRELAIQDPNADQWYELVLPALALEDDGLGREVGEALWPDRFPRENLLKIQALSDRLFQSLYQQNPRGSESQLFTRDGFSRVPCGQDYANRSAWCFDLALSERDSSDYTAFGRVHYWRDSRALQFSHVQRVRKEWPSVKALIKDLMRMYPDDDFVFSKHSYDLMAVQALKQEMPDARIKLVSQPGDKHERAATLSDWCANGLVNVCLCDDRDLFVREHELFPSGEHDDFVDMGSVATHHFGLHKAFKLAMGKAEREPVIRSQDLPREVIQ